MTFVVVGCRFGFDCVNPAGQKLGTKRLLPTVG